jgi:predicted metal-binding membrane protein
LNRSIALPRSAAAVIVAALLSCAAVAWTITIQQSSSMATGGLAMMGAGVFLVTWMVMMVAMMFPSVAPITLAFAGVTRSRGQGSAPTGAFVLGYLAVWVAAGLVPLGTLLVLDRLSIPGPGLVRLTGAVIAVAGVYQFTPLKNVCLRACRSPLGFVMTHDFGGGVTSAVRAGTLHGLFCLGCCWALMAVLAVLGLMSLGWMALVAAVFFVEKNFRFGDLLPAVVGVVCIVGGILLLVIA